MKKSIIQLLLLVSIFFGTWFLLSKVNWVGFFRTERWEDASEQKLGDLVWDAFRKTQHEFVDSMSISVPDQLLKKICDSNNIDPGSIHLHLIESTEVNAISLPGRHIVLFSALGKDCNDPGELAGVIAHEIAHLEQDHIQKKLVKEFGVAILMGLTNGKVDAGMLKQVVEKITGSAYDRSLEKEADLEAVHYLEASAIDPEHFASFMDRMGREQSSLPNTFSWISTHPASEQRAVYIRSSAGSVKEEPLFSNEAWKSWQLHLSGK